MGLLLALVAVGALVPPVGARSDFPAGYEGYHTYAEMVAELDRAVADHPRIVRKFSIGRSYEGRQLWVAKISDNVAVNEAEPEVLFDSMTHGREHLTLEMNLYLLAVLTDGYGADAQITRLVDSREIFLVLMVNPDGAQHDIASGEFAFWRKNRQPIPGTRRVGIDLNRNFGFKWGCCGGSSGEPRAETYRGWRAWVAPEVRAYRDFVRSRVVGGRQQIRVAVSWHSSGELILWPYGYTTDPAVRTMTADDRATYRALARQMARLNGYTARPSSSLYITDGDQTSWSHHEQRIFHFTFEMYPAKINFYPRPDKVGPQTRRNREAVLYLLEHAACPYRAAGLEATHCGPLNDDFEIGRGWQRNPFGTDTATGGQLERALPRKTRDAGGIKQRALVPSGEAAIVSGAAAGRNANSNDIDAGTTSIASPILWLGGGSGWRVTFHASFAHDARSSSADYVAVSVVEADGRRSALWRQQGSARNRNAEWRRHTLNLDAFAAGGRSIRLLFEASDGAGNSLVEVGLDDVRVYRATSSMVLNPVVGRTAVPALGAI